MDDISGGIYNAEDTLSVFHDEKGSGCGPSSHSFLFWVRFIFWTQTNLRQHLVRAFRSHHILQPGFTAIP